MGHIFKKTHRKVGNIRSIGPTKALKLLRAMDKKKGKPDGAKAN